jgi:hypothetical protein
MNAYSKSRGIVLLILNHGVGGGEWSMSLPHSFTPAKERWYPLDRKLGGTQSWSGHYGGSTSVYTSICQYKTRALIAVIISTPF